MLLAGGLDMKATLAGKQHYLLYCLTPAMKPRMLMTGAAAAASLRVAGCALFQLRPAGCACPSLLCMVRRARAGMPKSYLILSDLAVPLRPAGAQPGSS